MLVLRTLALLCREQPDLMRWFGYRPFAVICDAIPRTETPIGAPCCWCGEAIGPEENGFLILTDISADQTGELEEVPWHPECHVRNLVGGVNHQRGLCDCYGGTEPSDPAHLSPREAATQAADFYVMMNRPQQIH